MEQKTFLRYSDMIMRRAFRKAWNKIGALGTALGLIVSVIVTYLAEKPKSLADFGSSEAIMAAVIFLILFVVVMLWYLSREPVIIYNEQIVRIAEFQQEIVKLEEKNNPKLELTYDDSDSTSYHDWGDNLCDFRVRVKNIGSQQVEDVAIKMKQTRPATYQYFPIDLNITNNAPNFLNPSDICFVDVLETRPERKLFFYAKEEGLRQLRPLQDYEILISASGNNSPVTEKWFRFSVNKSNPEQPFIFKELADDESKE